MSRDDGEGFLSRWSRRKREEPREPQPAPARDESAPAAPDAATAQPPAAAADEPPALSEEELAALPPIETIDATTDISGYLRKGVPAALKNAALRRVWSATPAVRDYLDPAREYAYDWNTPGGVPGDGPLGADFDAKALADRLFKRRETKVVDDAGASPNRENTDDAVSQTADADVSGAEPEAIGDADRADAQDPQSSAAPSVAVGAPPPEADRVAYGGAKNAPDRSDLRPRPRRHGGATPV